MRKTAFIMGTAVVVDIPSGAKDGVFEEVFERLRQIDKRFSPYKKTSELSRLYRGELEAKDASPQMKMVMRACKKAQQQTDGYFSAYYKGEFEPSGYVKGWAVAEAEIMLVKRGFNTFCVSIGGDMVARSGGEKIWKIGIQDPFDKNGYVAKLTGKNLSLATSGSYERGRHIFNPKTGKPADELLSFSVVGPDIITADVLATAGFAAGKAGLKLVEKHKKYEALAIDKSGRILASKNTAKLIKVL